MPDKRAKMKQPQGGDNTGKVGSDPQAAHNFGGQNDFGDAVAEVHEQRPQEQRAKGSPGDSETLRTEDGNRVHGVGGRTAAAGSSSGGDLDPDYTGVGTGSGVATSGSIGDTSGPAMSDGSSNEFASGPPAKGENTAPKGTIGGGQAVKGTTHSAAPTDEGGPGVSGGMPTNAGESRRDPDKKAPVNPLTGGPGHRILRPDKGTGNG